MLILAMARFEPGHFLSNSTKNKYLYMKINKKEKTQLDLPRLSTESDNVLEYITYSKALTIN